MQVNQIIQGDALTKLKELDTESVDCCITSPPYWALRDYKTPGQIGLEPTFQEYIQKLVEIFAEVKRVLKKTGSLWVNLGDTYSAPWTGRNEKGKSLDQDPNEVLAHYGKVPYKMGIPEKSLCGIPQRFMIAMIDAGWICRNTIIWYKPNCMPSSARDRFTIDFEYIFFFTRSQKYYFETQYEPLAEITIKELEKDYQGQGMKDYEGNGVQNPSDIKRRIVKKYSMNKFGGNKYPSEYRYFSGKVWEPKPQLGRIKRCVWKIPTQPFSEAHFAVFPPAIVLTPLLATCPEYVCKKCGRPREKIYKRKVDYKAAESYEGKWSNELDQSSGKRVLANIKMLRELTGKHEPDWSPEEIGLTECGCGVGFDGGVCLDPFLGSGTVALVAMQNARNFIGIELNGDYIKMAMKRLEPYLSQSRLSNYQDIDKKGQITHT